MLTGLGFVIAASNAAIRVLFAMGRERGLPESLARLSGRRTPIVAIGFLAVLTLALGLSLTYADGAGPAAGYLLAAGGLAVVLVYLAGNIAVIRAFRTEFRDEWVSSGPSSRATLAFLRCASDQLKLTGPADRLAAASRR